MADIVVKLDGSIGPSAYAGVPQYFRDRMAQEDAERMRQLCEACQREVEARRGGLGVTKEEMLARQEASRLKRKAYDTERSHKRRQVAK